MLLRAVELQRPSLPLQVEPIASEQGWDVMAGAYRRSTTLPYAGGGLQAVWHQSNHLCQSIRSAIKSTK